MARQRTAKAGAQDPRRPTEQDREVGSRVKSLRKAAGLTQETLASALGISYQQVQKYEKGTSRMAGGRLRQAASLLGVPVQALISDGTPEPAIGFAEPETPYETSREATDLMRHFSGIKDPADREMLVRMARRLAKG